MEVDIMKLSTKGRYGLRAMIDMAQHNDQNPVAAHLIAERQGISERYLEQLMVPLKRAGLVKSLRGSQGGYLLGKSPGDITAGEVIRVLEGPLAPVECVNEINRKHVNAQTIVSPNIRPEIRDAVAHQDYIPCDRRCSQPSS
jgi:Rrf2 family protein